MMRILGFALAALLGLGHSALAANIMSCGQQTNFACASGTPAAQDITTVYNHLGATWATLEGATADGFETSVSVTDPTADRTLTIPNADTATAQAVSCGAGNHVSAFNVTTGAFTCTADSGGGSHTLLSATHTDTTVSTVTRGALIVGTGASPTWDDLVIGGANTFLHSDGTDATWAAISASDIGAGDLANVNTWNELKTSCSPNCTLANAPRVSTGATPTVLLASNGVVMKPVASCGTVNEFTISGTTITPCDTTNNADFLAYYER